MSVVSPTASRELRTDAGLAANLRISVMRLARRLRNERESDGLTLTQMAVLGTLWRSGPTTAGDLAAAEQVTPPSMTRTLGCLEEFGYVERRPHETDGRQVIVELTPAAHAVIERDRQRRTAWLAQRLSELDADERELLRRVAPLLDRLVEA
ncbi:MAG: MarR family winged helix-turn-helix transcriptional regulator [Desertimonas sp.]